LERRFQALEGAARKAPPEGTPEEPHAEPPAPPA
jgi:hypothetical protein